MTEERKIQLAAGLDATGIKQGAQEGTAAVRGMASEMKAAAGEAGQAVGGIGDSAGQSSAKVDRAARGIISSIERATAAAKAGGRGTAEYFEAIGAQRGVGADTLKPYIEQLRTAEALQKSAAASMGNLGVSAGQTRAALAGVPAQLQDIVVSLQGGQAPMTVLLQQGSQLATTFGGIGAAARGVGGFVLGLVNPFTVAAAAAAAFTAAYAVGSEELPAYTRALVSTGGAAGVTAGQLNEMAAAVRALGAGTQGAAAEALLQFAQAPAIGAENMQRFTAAALRFEQVGGQAAQATIKQFIELGNEPYKAAVKLNETTNFLTASLGRQIKQLEEQGRQTDAARLAQEAYAQAIEQRTPQIEASLGSIERAWREVKQAAKGALDDFISLGRQGTLDDQVSQQEARIAQLRAVAKSGIDLFRQASPEQIRSEEATLARLKEQQTLQRRAADETGRRATLTREALKWQEDSISYLDREARKQLEINKTRTEGQRLVEAGLLKEGELRDRLAAVAAKYTEKPVSRVGRTGSAADPFAADRAAAKEWETAYERFGKAAADAQGRVDGLTKSQVALLDYLQSAGYRNVSEPMRQLALQQGYAAVSAEQAAAEQKAWAQTVAQSESAYTSFIDELERAGDAADKQRQSLQDERQAAALVVPGMVSLRQAIQLVTIARLEDRKAVLGYSDEAVAAIQREIDIRKTLVDEIGADDQRAAVKQAADDAAKEWKRSATQIETSITDSLFRGFESGKSLAVNLRDTLVNTFKTTVLRPVISAVVNPLSGSLAASLGGLLGTGGATAGGLGGAGGLGTIGSLLGIGGTLATLGSYGATGLLATLTGTGIGTSLGAAGALVSSGSVAGGIGLGLGAAAPYVAAALVVANLLKDKDAKLGFGGASIGANGTTQIARQFAFGNGDDIGRQSDLQTIADSIGVALQQQAEIFGGSAQGLRIQVATDADRKGKASGSIQFLDAAGQRLNGLQTGGGNPLAVAAQKLGSQAEVATFFAENTTAALIAGLQQSDLPARFGDYFKAIDVLTLNSEQAAQVLAVATGVQQLTDGLEPLGGVFTRLGGLGIAATNDLAAMVGGLDAFSAKAQGYVQQFYSRDEIAGIKATEVQAALAAAGITGPVDTKDQFRALVDAADISTTAGREQLATLLNVSGAFAEVADYLAETSITLAQAATQAPSTGALVGLQAPPGPDVGPQITAIGAVETAVNGVGGLIRELIDVVRDQRTWGSAEVMQP